MKRFFGALLVVMAVGALAPAAMGAAPAVANGGGHGLEPGAEPFSQFGFGVTRSADGSLQGHFNCLMAGVSQFPGFTLMAVRGQVTGGTIGASAASFDGVGMFLAPGGPLAFEKAPATFHVDVTAGGPGVGTLHLLLLTPFPFDLGNETVMDGQISIH